MAESVPFLSGSVGPRKQSGELWNVWQQTEPGHSYETRAGVSGGGEIHSWACIVKWSDVAIARRGSSHLDRPILWAAHWLRNRHTKPLLFMTLRPQINRHGMKSLEDQTQSELLLPLTWLCSHSRYRPPASAASCVKQEQKGQKAAAAFQRFRNSESHVVAKPKRMQLTCDHREIRGRAVKLQPETDPRPRAERDERNERTFWLSCLVRWKHWDLLYLPSRYSYRQQLHPALNLTHLINVVCLNCTKITLLCNAKLTGC